MSEEKTLSSQLIYEGQAVRLRVDTVEMPSGRQITNIRVTSVPLSQIPSLIASGSVCDAKSISGLFIFLENDKIH